MRARGARPGRSSASQKRAQAQGEPQKRKLQYRNLIPNFTFTAIWANASLRRHFADGADSYQACGQGMAQAEPGAAGCASAEACSPVFFRNISFSCFQSTIVHRSRAAFSPISFHNRLRGLLIADWPNGWRLRCRCVVVSSHLVVVRFIPGDSIDVNQHFPDDRCIDRELRCRAAMAPTCHEGTCDAIGEHVYNYLTLTDP